MPLLTYAPNLLASCTGLVAAGFGVAAAQWRVALRPPTDLALLTIASERFEVVAALAGRGAPAGDALLAIAAA